MLSWRTIGGGEEEHDHDTHICLLGITRYGNGKEMNKFDSFVQLTNRWLILYDIQ